MKSRSEMKKKFTKCQLRFKIRVALSGIASSINIDSYDQKRSSITKGDLTEALIFITQADGILADAIKRPKKIRRK